MKNKILEITDRLEKDEIDYREARIALSKLFGFNYKSKLTGRAIVKSTSQKWIYDGAELEIVSLYMTHKDGFGVYPDGTREFRLSLAGTEYEFRNGHRQRTVVIPETDLEILELIED